MKKKYFFLLLCFMSTQLNAEIYLYESNGIHYVLSALTFGDATSRSAYVVHPEVTLDEEEETPTTPSSYTGAVVILDTIVYNGNPFPVKFIDENAFNQATITSIDLPECMTVFNPGSFKDCTSLQTIICRAQTPPSTRIHTTPWDYAETFGSLDPNQVAVYVPDGTVLMYQETGSWGTFTHIYPLNEYQGIESTQSKIENRKSIINGHLYIEKNGKTYTIVGQTL